MKFISTLETSIVISTKAMYKKDSIQISAYQLVPFFISDCYKVYMFDKIHFFVNECQNKTTRISKSHSFIWSIVHEGRILESSQVNIYVRIHIHLIFYIPVLSNVKFKGAPRLKWAEIWCESEIQLNFSFLRYYVIEFDALIHLFITLHPVLWP